MWPLGGGGPFGGGQQFDRPQQINELLVTQPQCRALNPDRSLLEVGVRLQDSTLTSLRISLPPGFPKERPALSITSPVRHPWVDSIGRLSFPMLDRWGGHNVRLAAVVGEAFKGLGGSPVAAPSKAGAQAAAQQEQQGQLGGAGSGLGSGPPSLAPASSSASLSAGGSGALPRPPPIPSTFEEVDALGDEELSAALSGKEAYQALVAAAAARLNLWQTVEKLKEETRELAAANLARAEEQAGIRNQAAVVRASDYAPAKAAFDAKWARQQAVLAKLSPDVLMRRLHDATREAEEEGERLVAQLGAGDLGVDEFVMRYAKAQATYHQREIKLQAAQQTLPTLGGR